VKTADLLLAISERTRLDFIEHLGVDPDRIVNIGTGVSTFFTPPEPGEGPRAERPPSFSWASAPRGPTRGGRSIATSASPGLAGMGMVTAIVVLAFT